MPQLPLSLPGYRGPIRDTVVDATALALRRGMRQDPNTHIWSTTPAAVDVSNFIPTANQLVLAPLPVLSRDMHIKEIVARTTQAGAAGSILRLGLFHANFMTRRFELVSGSDVTDEGGTVKINRCECTCKVLARAGELYYAGLRGSGGAHRFASTGAYSNRIIPVRTITMADATLHSVAFSETTAAHGTATPLIVLLSERGSLLV